MTLRLGGDGAITGCTSLENPDLTVSGLTISGSFDAEKVLVASGTAAAPSYTFSGDTDNGLYYAGTNSIGLSTNGTNAILIDSSGNVGIGTTSPTAKVHITNNSNSSTQYLNSDAELLISALGTKGATLKLTNGGSLTESAIVVDQNTTLKFTAREFERMRIDSSGRLLVGTSSDFGSGSPGDLIEAASGSGGHLLLGRNDSSVTIDESMALIRGYSYGGSVWEEAGRISIQADATHGSGSKAGRIVFATTANGAASPTERLRIDSSGRVGIGVTSVNAIRAVEIKQPNGYVAGLRIMQDGSGAYNQFFSGISNWRVGSPQLTNALTFDQGSTTSEAMRIDSSGNLNLTGSTDQRIRLNTSGAGGNDSVNIRGDGNALKYNCALGTTGVHIFETGGTERMRILSSGGLTFNGDTAQANALDDYEAGVWNVTPTSATWTVQRATYVKVGRQVTVFFSGTISSPSASVARFPLPFTSDTSTSTGTGSGVEAHGSVMINGGSPPSNTYNAVIYMWSTEASIYFSRSAVAWYNALASQLGSSIQFTATYFAA